MIKQCLICGIDFYAKPYQIRKGNAKYCSRKCFHDAKPKVEKICHICDKKFLVQNSHNKHFPSKYCSMKCYRIQQRALPGTKDKISNQPKRYIRIYQPHHPHCFKCGYVPEHRLIAEKALRRFLKPEEVIHHINGIRKDNRLENLYLFSSNKEHLDYHNFSKNKVLVSNLI